MAQWERVAQFYNQISGLYPIINLGLAPYKKYLKHELDSLPDGLLLDIGTGHGGIFDLGLQHIITGIDISEAMLAKARKNYPDAQLIYNPSHKLPMENESYNYVVMAHVISHMSNQRRGVNEALRVLKPGGYLFILNHFSKPGWQGWPSKLFSAVSGLLAFSSSIGVQDITDMHPKMTMLIIPADKWGNYKIIKLTKP
jgi:ubiquinone/menaquinone biosynthesis C-methylase UbiE